MTRSLTVWWDGVIVGSLALDRNGAVRFAYGREWIEDASAPPIAFSLPGLGSHVRGAWSGLRMSLAGGQSKIPVVLVAGRVALPAPGQPTTHILKPAMPDLEATTENEAFAMRLAARLGLAVAPVRPEVDGGPGFPHCFDLIRRVCTRPGVAVLGLLDAAILREDALVGQAALVRKRAVQLARTVP